MIFPLIFTHGQGAEGAETRRAYQRGELLRLRRGCYIDAQTWSGYGAWRRYDAFAEAIGSTVSERTLVLRTAARIWGLPLRTVPDSVDVLARNHAAIRQEKPRPMRFQRAAVPANERFPPTSFGIRHRYLYRPAVRRVGGLRISELVDTALQCAAYLPFEEAVMVIDAALSGRAKGGDDA
ncbi:hypothetical protein GCM10027591_13040 [Zhihengliuella somnathii]